MIDEAYDYEDHDRGGWRLFALTTAIGIGAWVGWRWLSRGGGGDDLGAKVRAGVGQVKQRVAEWTGGQEPAGGIDGAKPSAQEPGYRVDALD